MPYIVDIQTSFPEYYYKQDELIENIVQIWKDKVKNLDRVRSIHGNVLVDGRHLSMPLEDYFAGKTFNEKNNTFIKQAVALGKSSIEKVLKNNNLQPEDISSLWSNSVTGFAIPSIEARVMNLLPFKKNTKRVPLMGLGCMAGVAGINRVADYLKAYPYEAVIFFSTELCSLTGQFENVSVANLISTGLFGDGSAAVLMVGDEHALATTAPLKWIGSESVFFEDSEMVMGWDVGEKGLQVILSKGVPDITEKELPGPVRNFLASSKLFLSNIDSFFAHPGGPKVLTALEKVLDLPNGGLKHSWDSLWENGNMSSVSVLDIIKRHLDEYDRKELKGKFALSLAMGPAFSAELGLLQWN